MRVPNGTTILVADGRKRLIARNTGDADTPSLTVVSAVEDASHVTREIASEGAVSIEVSAPQDHEEERFAVETAQLLRRGVEDGSYEQLIIIAAPKTLGSMRKHYHKMVVDKIIGEIGKDVTSQPIGAIEKLLIAQ